MMYLSSQEKKARQMQELKDLALLNGKIQHLQEISNHSAGEQALPRLSAQLSRSQPRKV